jgi:hypothetical protein
MDISSFLNEGIINPHVKALQLWQKSEAFSARNIVDNLNKVGAPGRPLVECASSAQIV